MPDLRCDFHCEGGWLPLDREADYDAIWLDEDEGPYEFLPLLMPTQFVACPCNPRSAVSDEINY